MAQPSPSALGHFFPATSWTTPPWKRVIGEAVAALGSVQFCVNTAGGGVAKRTIASDFARMHPPEDFQRIIDFKPNAFIRNRVAASHMANNEPNEAGERGVMINTAPLPFSKVRSAKWPTRRQKQVSPA